MSQQEIPRPIDSSRDSHSLEAANGSSNGHGADSGDRTAREVVGELLGDMWTRFARPYKAETYAEDDPHDLWQQTESVGDQRAGQPAPAEAVALPTSRDGDNGWRELSEKAALDTERDLAELRERVLPQLAEPHTPDVESTSEEPPINEPPVLREPVEMKPAHLENRWTQPALGGELSSKEKFRGYVSDVSERYWDLKYRVRRSGSKWSQRPFYETRERFCDFQDAARFTATEWTRQAARWREHVPEPREWFLRLRERIEESKPVAEALPERVEQRQNEWGIDIGSHTETNPAQPDRHQDALLLAPDLEAAAIVSNLSDQPGDRVATRLAHTAVHGRLRIASKKATLLEAKAGFKDALEFANNVITESRSDKYPFMATTISMIQLWRPRGMRKPELMVGNIGKARVYRLTVDDELQQVTLDHDRVYDKLSESDARDQQVRDALNPEYKAPSSATKALGSKGSEAHIRIQTVEANIGDRFLISTVHDTLTDQEIYDILMRNNAETSAQKLVAEARKRSKNPDHRRAKQEDLSAVIVDV